MLELGSGLALPGILAAYLNSTAGLVVVTDGDELALEKVSVSMHHVVLHFFTADRYCAVLTVFEISRCSTE